MVAEALNRNRVYSGRKKGVIIESSALKSMKALPREDRAWGAMEGKKQWEGVVGLP